MKVVGRSQIDPPRINYLRKPSLSPIKDVKELSFLIFLVPWSWNKIIKTQSYPEELTIVCTYMHITMLVYFLTDTCIKNWEIRDFFKTNVKIVWNYKNHKNFENFHKVHKEKMSVRVNVRMSKIMRTLIKVELRTYSTYANCRTLRKY